jgi:hypothetical protein
VAARVRASCKPADRKSEVMPAYQRRQSGSFEAGFSCRGRRRKQRADKEVKQSTGETYSSGRITNCDQRGYKE